MIISGKKFEQGLRAVGKSIDHAEKLKMWELHRNCRKAKVDAGPQIYVGALAEAAYRRIRIYAEIYFIAINGRPGAFA